MIRAYADPALRYPLGRSGTWRSALEVPLARGHSRAKRVYLHNASSAAVLLKPEARGVTEGFVVSLPESVNARPGVTPVTLTVTASGDVPLPSVSDFVVVTSASAGDHGRAGFSDMAHSDLDHTLEGRAAATTAVRFEASAFALASADERFGDLGTSPLRDVARFTEYLASGMGFVDEAYQQRLVGFMSDMGYDLALWALNKHHRLEPECAPMRLVAERARAFGYDPPGVAGLPPALRRRVYARAFELARASGSAAGIRGIFAAIGVPLAQVAVRREAFTWRVRVPQWVAGAFSLDLLGQLALYHVDAYCDVDLAVIEGTVGGTYSDLDYTVTPPDTLAGGLLLTEDGVSYLLLEDGTKMRLEG